MSGSLVSESMAMAGMRPEESNFGAKSEDSSICFLSLRSEKICLVAMIVLVEAELGGGDLSRFDCVWTYQCSCALGFVG